MSRYGFHLDFPEPIKRSNLHDEEPVSDFPQVVVIDGQAVTLTPEDGAEPPKKKVEEVIQLALVVNYLLC